MFVARIFTLYPEFFPGPLEKGLYGKALDEKCKTSSFVIATLLLICISLSLFPSGSSIVITPCRTPVLS